MWSVNRSLLGTAYRGDYKIIKLKSSTEAYSLFTLQCGPQCVGGEIYAHREVLPSCRRVLRRGNRNAFYISTLYFNTKSICKYD